MKLKINVHIEKDGKYNVSLEKSEHFVQEQSLKMLIHACALFHRYEDPFETKTMA